MEILLIEGNAQDAQQVRAALEETGPLGCRLHIADCLAQGVAALGQSAFDAVLLDLDLPDSSGVDTWVNLKFAALSVPIIVLADVANAKEILSVLKDGAQSVLFKRSPDLKRLSRQVLFSSMRYKQELELRQKEERFRTVIENLKDAYYEVDLNANLLYFNDATVQHFGRSREELTGMNSREYTPKEDAKKIYTIYTQVFKTGKPARIDSRPLIRPDGSVRMVELNIALIRDVKDRPVGFSGVSRDVTDHYETQKALKLSKEKYQTILESIQDVYFEVDLKGRMLFLNRASEGLYGYSLQELQNADNRLYMDEKNGRKVLEAYHRIYQTGEPNRFLQYEVTHRDGTTHFVESSIALMKDATGRALGFRGVGRYITQRKAKELELIQAKEKAEAATQAKSEFLANMSHEIRTPMNGIIGMYTLLQSTELTREQTDFVHTGKRSADALLMIINDILDFSKIEAGQLDMEMIDFNLRTTIEEMVALPATQAHAKNIEFMFHIDHQVSSLLKGDPGRVRQIILNLTTNGVKFTDKGEVALFVTLESESDTHVWVRFSVKDTGIGISAADQARLFKSFEQMDRSTTRKYGGTGLGLAISARLTELMGGRMGVESTLGQGSTFWTLIEFEKITDRSEPEWIAPEQVRDKRILIVDDNKTNLTILEGYLAGWGCTCDQASSAKTALVLLNALAKAGKPYDLVISDMIMPEMDGPELGRRIKADPGLQHTLMILLTSQGLRGDAAKMKQIGFSAYLTKPVRPTQLYDCMMAVLSRRETAAEEKLPAQLITNHSLSDAKRRKIKVLLVEDNAINRKLAIYLLERFGFKANAVFDGKAAIEALCVTAYDLVLMDIEMPQMDGYAATQLIRNPESAVLNHQVPIIAMTAHAAASDRQACLAAGMDDYISKPIQPDELLRVIEKCITDRP